MAEQQKQMTTLDLVSYNLNGKYMKQVINYFNGDRNAAMRFMTGAVDYVRRTPKLQECDAVSVINSLMLIASFKFIPSSVGGEAYIIPYKGKAQFQPGYKGYVTLFYRAGVKKVWGDIVRANDKYEMVDGELTHNIDLAKSMQERGKPIGAYIKIILPSGELMTKYMNEKDILEHGKKFSQSFKTADSPWNPENDPELWMWKKTVLIQASKFVPKNDELVRAMEEDFKDSVIDQKRLAGAKDESQKLSMGNFLQDGNQNKNTKESENGDDEIPPPEGDPINVD